MYAHTSELIFMSEVYLAKRPSIRLNTLIKAILMPFLENSTNTRQAADKGLILFVFKFMKTVSQNVGRGCEPSSLSSVYTYYRS